MLASSAKQQTAESMRQKSFVLPTRHKAAVRMAAVKIAALAILFLGRTQTTAGSYIRGSDITSSALISASETSSRLSCAIACQVEEDPECIGLTYTASGSCQLFSDVVPGPDSRLVEYVVPWSPCRPDWYFYRDSCYLRTSDGAMTRASAKHRCGNVHAPGHLVFISDERELSWLFHHPSRPDISEWTGTQSESDGTFRQVDGSPAPYHPPISGRIGKCLHLPSQRLSDSLNRVTGSELADGYVCESSLRCNIGSPCPVGWLGLDHFCYLYVSDAKIANDADLHCGSLHKGARLSSVVNMGTWRVLHQHFWAGERIQVGINDIASMGSFQSVDGSDFSIDWAPGEPNSGTEENCVAMKEDLTAIDISCSTAKPFLCRAPVINC